MSSNDDLDINLEPVVLMALSKLQKMNRNAKTKQPNPAGVPCKKIVEFLKANCPWVDGDVESQVMTALLSCVKTGIVCALDNRKFILIRASAKKMISNCVTRVSHGPKCCCLPMLKSLLKTFPRTCCYIKKAEPVKKSKKPPVRASRRRLCSKPKPPPSSKRKTKGPARKGCAQRAQVLMGTSKSGLSLNEQASDKCGYCMEIHSLPKLRKFCMTCYPVGNFNPVPEDKFSPRDEHPPVENAAPNTVRIVAENTEK